MSEAHKVPQDSTRPSKREEFIPETGNPENGNYADYLDHLEEARKVGVELPQKPGGNLHHPV